jgi:hypothetical protein
MPQTQNSDRSSVRSRGEQKETHLDVQGLVGVLVLGREGGGGGAGGGRVRGLQAEGLGTRDTLLMAGA